MDSAFQAFLDAVDAAHDDSMIRQATKAFAISIGFERFAYLQVEGKDIKTLNNYGQPWEEEYLEKEFSTLDPVVIEGKRRMKPFSWSADDWPARGSTDLRRFRDAAILHGIRSGMTIPVPGSYGSTIMLTFASADARSTTSASLSPEGAVQAALMIHCRLRFLAAGKLIVPTRVFSSKEAVCVTWSAKGKKAHEIADIMQISERTVQHYLDSARQKLDAQTVQHLTAMAALRGMVEN